MFKIFIPGEEVDIEQSVMTGVLLNEHKDGSGKWPHEFDGRKYLVHDKFSKYYEIPLKVTPCKKNEFVKDMKNKKAGGLQKNTYVLVYPMNFDEPDKAKHCVYAEGFENGEAVCLNSIPSDPTPRIPLWHDELQFYKVSSEARPYKDTNIIRNSPAPGGSLASQVLNENGSPQPQINEDQVDGEKRPIAVDIMQVDWKSTEADIRYDSHLLRFTNINIIKSGTSSMTSTSSKF